MRISYLMMIDVEHLKTSMFHSFAPRYPLGCSHYQPTFKQEYLEHGKSKRCLHFKVFQRIFDNLSNNTPIDKLRICGSLNIDVWSLWKNWNLKIEFFTFSVTERVSSTPSDGNSWLWCSRITFFLILTKQIFPTR